MSAREILNLARATGVDARTRVLDLCCGSGGPALHLARQTGCRIVGVDRSSEAATWPEPLLSIRDWTAAAPSSSQKPFVPR